jgi:hypothetical protein
MKVKNGSRDNRIRKVSNGIITTVAGTGRSGFNGDGEPATSAQLSDPAGIRFDDVGNLYIAERVGNRIRVLLTNGTSKPSRAMALPVTAVMEELRPAPP